METILACNDPTILLRVRECLNSLGIECATSQVVSLDSVQSAVLQKKQAVLVIFGSQRFEPEELSLLRQLCAGTGNSVKVVAVGPTLGSNAILQAIRCGAADYLDINANFADELRSLFERLKAAQGERAQVGRLFTVLGTVGGVGSSFLATNLAAALAQKERACILLDLQLRGGDLATLLKATPRHTLLSLAEKAQHLDRTMFDQSLLKHECGVHLLASPEPFSDYRKISSQVIQSIVQLARASGPNVVVDLEDAEHPEQVRTLAASDQIILALRLDFVSLHRTKKCVDHLLRANVPRNHITLVANRTGQPKELPAERVAEILGLPLAHLIPNDPSGANASVNLGVPLVISSPTAKVSMSIVRLAEALSGKEADHAPPPQARQLFSLKKAAAFFGALQV